MLDCVVFVTC